MGIDNKAHSQFMDVIASTDRGRTAYRHLSEQALRTADQWYELEQAQPAGRRNDLEGIGNHVAELARTPLRVSVYGRPLDGKNHDLEDLYRKAYARSVRNNMFLSAMAKHWLNDRLAQRIADASAIRLMTWQARDAFDEEEYLAHLIGSSAAWRIRQEIKPSSRSGKASSGSANTTKARKPKPRFTKKELADPTPVYREIAWIQERDAEDVRLSVERRITKGTDPTESLVMEYGAYAPTGTMIGIDLETTGVSSNSSYIVDAGWESFDMTDGRAFDAERHTYGISKQRSELGIKDEITALTGIGTQTVAGFVPFQEDPDAQRRMMDALDGHVMVAHNANFERTFLMGNCAGFAESLRSGGIRIVDSMKVAQHSEDVRCQGFKLDDYARRNHALDADRDLFVPSGNGGTLRLDQGETERHLGLEDAHIMMRAMRNQLGLLHERHDHGERVMCDDTEI